MEIFARSTFSDRARSSSRSIGPSNPSSRSRRFSGLPPSTELSAPGGGGVAMSDKAAIHSIEVMSSQPEQGAERPGQHPFQRLSDGVEADQARQDEHHQQYD